MIDPKLESKSSKGCIRKQFGEDIGKLILRGDKTNLNLFLYNPVVNKVIIHLNMLSTSMENGIRGEIGSAKVITPNVRSREGGNL